MMFREKYFHGKMLPENKIKKFYNKSSKEIQNSITKWEFLWSVCLGQGRFFESVLWFIRTDGRKILFLNIFKKSFFIAAMLTSKIVQFCFTIVARALWIFIRW